MAMADAGATPTEAEATEASEVDELVFVKGEAAKKVSATSLERIARMTAEAYRESPVYKYIFQGEPATAIDNAMQLHRSFTGLCKTKPGMHLRYATTGAAPSADVVCSFILIESDSMPGLLDYLWGGLIRVCYRLGWGTTRRMLRAGDLSDVEMDAASAAAKERAGTDKVLVLQRMVVSPETQGKGVGSRSLAAALAEPQFAKWPCVLSTQEEINRQFYEKRGFEVFRRKPFDVEPGTTIPSITMIRMPPS